MLHYDNLRSFIDYEEPYDPDSTVNPREYAIWLNTISGEMFACLNNWYNDNVWKSLSGRIVTTNHFA